MYNIRPQQVDRLTNATEKRCRHVPRIWRDGDSRLILSRSMATSAGYDKQRFRKFEIVKKKYTLSVMM